MARKLPPNAHCPYCVQEVMPHCGNKQCTWFACPCGAFGPREDFRPFTHEQTEKPSA